MGLACGEFLLLVGVDGRYRSMIQFKEIED